MEAVDAIILPRIASHLKDIARIKLTLPSLSIQAETNLSAFLSTLYINTSTDVLAKEEYPPICSPELHLNNLVKKFDKETFITPRPIHRPIVKIAAKSPVIIVPTTSIDDKDPINYGYTLLHKAVSNKNVAKVKELLYEKKASPFVTDDFGCTPHQLALNLKLLEISAILLACM